MLPTPGHERICGLLGWGIDSLRSALLAITSLYSPFVGHAQRRKSCCVVETEPSRGRHSTSEAPFGCFRPRGHFGSGLAHGPHRFASAWWTEQPVPPSGPGALQCIEAILAGGATRQALAAVVSAIFRLQCRGTLDASIVEVSRRIGGIAPVLLEQ